jgi:hypothetical protein
MKRVSSVFAALTAACLFALGCGRPAADPAVVAEHRGRLELAEEPDGAQTVLEVRQVMYGEDPEATPDHANHDHDGDGVQDHAPEDHVDAEHEHADHDHEGEDHADHDHAADAGDDAEEPAAGEPASAGGEPASADHGHEAHDDEHAGHDHEAHDHKAEDHAAHEDHDHAHDEPASAKVDADKKPVIDEMDVVMVGSVGGVPNPSDQAHPEFPFADGKAMFFLADPEAVAEMEEHEHKHAPGEECAFCLAHAGDSAHMIAVVQFADKDGKPLNVDARDLFELKEKETVVVKGKAKIAPGGMLTVDATGLYVRR